MRLFLSLSILVLLVSCTPTNRNAWTAKDSWYNEPSQEGLTPWNWEKVNFIEVAVESQPKAQTLLESSLFFEISDENLDEFITTGIKANENSKSYLVRGVYLNEGTGQFSVYRQSNQLWIYHGSLGKAPVSMKRKVLIVYLQAEPKEVFVTCSMAE